MKIAYFSPLNPLKTGISDYSEEILLKLKERVGQIDLFTDNYIPSNTEINSNFNIYQITSFEQMYSEYDEIIYHIGNNAKYHEQIYLTALKYPGIIVLHDFAIHHLIAQLTVGRNNWEDYIEEMKYNYGEDGVEMAIESQNGHRQAIWETDMTLQYPINKRIIDKSKGVIVHSKFAKQQIIENIKPDCVVQYAPLFAENIEKIGNQEMIQLRKRYGIDEQALVFSSFGFISRAKRIDVVIDIIEELKNTYSNFIYLLVGEEEKDVYEMSKYIKSKNVDKYVKYIGYVNLEEFKDYVKLSDICINLRYPTQGETSASLLRIIGYGKPVIVTDIGSFSELSNDCCFKVNMASEKTDIKKYLKKFLDNPYLAKEIGQRASNYVQENYNVNQTLDAYVNILKWNFDFTELRYYEELFNSVTEDLISLGISSSDDMVDEISNLVGEII
ncbi:glycosyltransferase [Lysinibacillus sp. FSL K6-0232]|uniref:glycosyltransferase family 4 protein n=1 Tax=Lysinibacillus sp. FSL K6-0232 TaxID=2921425 RepID=UPI0030FB492E